MSESHGPVTLHHGDCLEVLRTLPGASVDAVVTDPPYGLGFMGKEWDELPPGREWAEECLRVLKPGGHMLAFGGTRTWHRLACAVEDAGFEIRDSIAWLYGSGFPKSLDVSKTIDKAAGAEREIVGAGGKSGKAGDFAGEWDTTAPATPDAERWQGWGTALKPAFEPVVVARKPLAGTVAANVLAYGTGALNIDGCRVEHNEPAGKPSHGMHGRRAGIMGETIERYRETTAASTAGRWPANVVLDEHQAAELDQQSGETTSNVRQPTGKDTRGIPNTASEMVMRVKDTTVRGMRDEGGASRYFYVAKADSSERVRVDGTAHPTVKPLALMRWLVRLATPPGGVVLEPFAGSGTTAEACLLEGFRCIAIEREADYLPLIRQRLNRRRDPVAAVRATGDDGGLFDLIGEGA